MRYVRISNASFLILSTAYLPILSYQLPTYLVYLHPPPTLPCLYLVYLLHITHRIDLREEAIIDNATSKVRRVLPLNSLIGICRDIPRTFIGSIQKVVSLPILGR